MGRDVPAGLAAAPSEEDAHGPIQPPRPTMPYVRRDKHLAIPWRLRRSAVISADRSGRGDAALLAPDSGLVAAMRAERPRRPLVCDPRSLSCRVTASGG